MADQLDEMFPKADEPEVEPVQQEAAAEPQPETVEEKQPEPEPTPPRPEPGFVPIAAVMDERDKRKALEAEVARYREQAKQPTKPDPIDDPEAFEAYLSQRLDERLTAERFKTSDRYARKEHGAEAVEAATAWAQDKAQADPSFAIGYMQSDDPIEWIVQQHKRDALLADIGPNMDDWFAREAAKRGYVTQTATVAAVPASPPAAIAQQTPKSAPPRSIASEASSHSTSSQPGSWMDGFIR